MNVCSIDDLLALTESKAIPGVAGRIRNLAAGKGDAVQTAELYDSRTGARIALSIHDAERALHTEIEDVPVYLVANTDSGNPTGIAMTISRDGDKRCVRIKAACRVLIAQNRDKAISYREWLETLPGPSKSHGPTPTASAKPPQSAPTSHSAAAPKQRRRAAADQSAHKDTTSDIPLPMVRAFMAARANTQAMLVARLEAIAFASAINQELGHTLDETAIGAITSNLNMRNCMGDKLNLHMPAAKDCSRAQLALEPIIRAHEKVFGYKLTDKATLQLLSHAADDDERFVREEFGKAVEKEGLSA